MWPSSRLCFRCDRVHDYYGVMILGDALHYFVDLRLQGMHRTSSTWAAAWHRLLIGFSFRMTRWCRYRQVRQRGVVRKPAHVHNYVHNAQMVVDALAGPILNMDLSHITGEAIVRGDTVAIRSVNKLSSIRRLQIFES